jgi:hypothetical protein
MGEATICQRNSRPERLSWPSYDPMLEQGTIKRL